MTKKHREQAGSPEDTDEESLKKITRSQRLTKIAENIGMAAMGVILAGTLGVVGFHDFKRPTPGKKDDTMALLNEWHPHNVAKERELKKSLGAYLEGKEDVSMYDYTFKSDQYGHSISETEVENATERTDKNIKYLKKLKKNRQIPEVLQEIERITNNTKTSYAKSRTSIIRFANRAGLDRRGNCEPKAQLAAIFLEEVFPDRKEDISFQIYIPKDENEDPHIRTLLKVRETGITYAIEPDLPQVSDQEKAQTIIVKKRDLIAWYVQDPRFMPKINAPFIGSARGAGLGNTDSILNMPNFDGTTMSYKKQTSAQAAKEWTAEQEAVRRDLGNEIKSIVPKEDQQAVPATGQIDRQNLQYVRSAPVDFSVDDAKELLKKITFKKSQHSENAHYYADVEINAKNPSAAAINALNDGIRQKIKKLPAPKTVGVDLHCKNIGYYTLDAARGIFDLTHDNLKNIFYNFDVSDGAISENFLRVMKEVSKKKYEKDTNGYEQGKDFFNENYMKFIFKNTDRKPIPQKHFQQLLNYGTQVGNLVLEGFHISAAEAQAVVEAEENISERETARKAFAAGKNEDYDRPMLEFDGNDTPKLIDQDALHELASGEFQYLDIHLSRFFDHAARDPYIISVSSPMIYGAGYKNEKDLEDSYQEVIKVFQRNHYDTEENKKMLLDVKERIQIAMVYERSHR